MTLDNWITRVIRQAKQDAWSGVVMDIPNIPAKYERLLRDYMTGGLAHGRWLAHVYLQEIRGQEPDINLKARLEKAIGSKIQLADSDWDEVLPLDAIKWIENYTPSLAGNLKQDMLEKVQQVLRTTLFQGLSIRDCVKALDEAAPELHDMAKARLNTIARTELTRADTMGRLIEYKTSDDVEGVEFSAILDDRTTAICESRHGLVMRLDDPRLARNSPPLHPNCRSLLLAVTIYDKKAGWQTSPEFDDVPESLQRDIDVEEVQKILDSNELTTGVVRENIPGNNFAVARPLAVEKGPSERLVLDVPDDTTLDLNFADKPREYTEATLEQADKDLLQATSRGWRVLNDAEKRVAFDYTDNSSAINGSLYSGKGPIHKDVEPLTRLIEKMPRTEFDMYVWRGCGYNALASFLGTDQESLLEMSDAELQALEGHTNVIYNFVSTSITRDRSYAATHGSPVEMKILILKGTEAVYMAPFSREGPMREEGINWDGLDPTPKFDQHPGRKDEIEELIQRGASYSARSLKRFDDKFYVELEVRLDKGYKKFG